MPRRPLKKDLRSSSSDAAAFSVMVGVGETYLPAFALAIGLGEVIAGLTSTVPMMAGAALQLLAPKMIRHVGSHRRWVVLCAAIQALSFLPLVAGALVGKMSWWAVFAVAALYWGAGLATGPAWNTWMGRTVPQLLRARYFSTRTRIAQVSVLVGLLVGGITLYFAARENAVLFGFAAMFVVACGARLISAFFLWRQSEPRLPGPADARISLFAFSGRLRKPEGRLLAYMLTAQTATYMAAPYFNPFMLGQLKFPYHIYLFLLATAFISKAIALPRMGHWADRFGAKSLLWIGGVGIVPLPAFWLFSNDWVYLAALQVVSGVFWAAFEFATFLLLFETIRDEERTSILTSFNLLNALAIGIGSLVGGLMLKLAGADRFAYLLVFFVSSAGRLVTLPLLHKVSEVPHVLHVFGFRPLAVRPAAGSFDRPIVPSIEEDVDVGTPI